MKNVIDSNFQLKIKVDPQEIRQSFIDFLRLTNDSYSC